MELIVYDTPDGVAEGAATRIADLIESASNSYTIGLAGGSTPTATYEALRSRSTEWSRVDAWLSDERWVAPDNDRSNGAMAARSLMDHVDARFHRPHWSEFVDAADSAAHYEATIRSLHENKQPDLILLGMGEDGHTASLFAGSQALDEMSRWFVANTIPDTGEHRLTATYPLLWAAQRLVVLTTGQAKAPAMRDAFGSRSVPIGRIDEGDAEVEWHVDRSAASLVS